MHQLLYVFIIDGSLPDPHQQPIPPVIKPLHTDDGEMIFGEERVERRRGSVSTNHTEASEK